MRAKLIDCLAVPRPPSEAPTRSLPLALRVPAALAVTALDAALLALALGGVGALAAHPRALALVAVWGVDAVALAWLRPVRAHRPRALEREPRAVFVLLFALPLAIPPLAAWCERAGLGVLPGGAALGWAGVAIAAAGLALRLVAMARLGSRFSPLVAVQEEHALEIGGPYAYVRHPGYLGAIAASLGAALAFRGGPALALLALFAGVVAGRVRREERLLARHFGDRYLDYRRRTGALLPRLGPLRRG